MVNKRNKSDEPVKQEKTFSTLLRAIDPQPEETSPQAAQRFLKRVSKALDTLTAREREIMKLRYGLADGYTYTLEEVGHIFHVTGECIRQIEKRAVQQLKAHLAAS